MAIADLLRNFGGKVGDTFASMGSTPLGNLTPEQQRRQNQMQGLRNLGEQFQILGAMQSNRPQQAAFIQNQIKQREIDALNTEQKRKFNEFLSTPDGSKYQRMVDLLGVDLTRQTVAKNMFAKPSDRKIIKGNDGFNYYADSGERVLPNVQSAAKDASVERFGVYDPETNQLIGTVLKTDQPTIDEVQNSGNIVGALRSPSVDSGSTRQYQVVDQDNKFVRNVSANELNLNPLQPGEKLTNLPTGTEAASSSSTTDDLFDDTRNRFNAVNTIVAETSKLAQQFYDDPTSALATGSAAGFVDALVKNIDSATQLFTGKEDSKAYKMAQRNRSEEGTDFGQRIEEASISSGVAESRIRDLAYLFAAARGQEGRGLSDKDYENALRIVSGGVGAKGRIAVLEDVSTRLSEQFSRDLETDKSVYDDKLEYINKVNKLPPLEVFVNPYTLINPAVNQAVTTSDGPK